jgi:hypothetical protein
MIPRVTASMLNARRRASAATDPYFANVEALLHFDGADGSTTFTDVTGRTWSIAAGLPALETDQSKWGGSSLHLPGTGGSIKTADSTDLQFDGSKIGTIECWVYIPATITTDFVALIDKWVSTGNSGYMLHFRNSTDRGKLQLQVGANTVSTAGVLALTTWHFVQVTLDGTNAELFVNGSSAGTASLSGQTVTGAGQDLFIGGDGASTNQGRIYVDDFRLTKGVARANSVPTAAFPDS